MPIENKNPWKLYIIGGYLVRARKSPGGAFYDIEVVQTGMTGRYLAEVFELNAYEVNDEKC